VYGHHQHIPTRCYGKHNVDAYVSASNVQYASDKWDTEGILEDIDTQWGAVPGGGCLEVAGWGSD
jgi:hypothetical protein